MGTLLGHLLPGSFFIAFALWWSFITHLRYIRSTRGRSKTCKYRATTAMPCICCPFGLKNLPIEPLIKIFFMVLGILGEVVTGVKIHHNSNVYIPSEPHEIHEHHSHVHKRDDHLSNSTNSITTWTFEFGNAQHATMYAAFALGALVEVLIHYRVELPKSIEFACGFFGFATEALLFSFHVHGQDDIERLGHQLLLIAIYGCIISGALEAYNRENVLFTYARILFTFLQGTWFFQIGFSMWPPFKFLENLWDPNNHQHLMFFACTFVWHAIIIFISLLIQLLILRKFVSKYSNVLDELNSVEYYSIAVTSSPKYTELTEETELNTKFDIDDDSEIEFDNLKLIQKAANVNLSGASTSSERRK